MQWFLEHLFGYSTEKVDLTPSSTLFLELELVELDVFGRKIYGAGEVELLLLLRSAAKHPLYIYIEVFALGQNTTQERRRRSEALPLPCFEK
jgi:hypothetical protein